MEEFTADALEVWESEGGAPARSGCLTGTVNQVDWAEQIKEQVSKEFDRVANAMNSVAGKQSERDRADTDAVIAILEGKRADVMGNDQAGYFIHDWQEMRGQVRQMIVQDPRYQAIKTIRAARRGAPKLKNSF